MSDDKDKPTARRLGVALAKYQAWMQRNVPPGIRSVLGVLLIAGGVLGFLPVLGFWMVPLGVAALALDVMPVYRRLRGGKDKADG